MGRNPRRAYDKEGREIQPATVASQLALGRRKIEICCNACGRHRSGIDVGELPPATPIPDICLRYRCSICGSKNLMSRPDVSEDYAAADARRKERSE